MTEDELVEAAKNFIAHHRFKKGQLVKFKKNMKALLGVCNEFEGVGGVLVFIEYIKSPIAGTSDDPLSPWNWIIADCLIMSPLSADGCIPCSCDSRFLEPIADAQSE